MFDIGFPELMVVSIVALLILGPERLPEALRTLGLWMGRLRRSFTAVKSELEKELGMDDIRRQLHNESVMEEMQRIEAEVQNSLDADAASANPATKEAGADNSIAPPAEPTTSPAPVVKSTEQTKDQLTDQPTDVKDDRANNA